MKNLTCYNNKECNVLSHNCVTNNVYLTRSSLLINQIVAMSTYKQLTQAGLQHLILRCFSCCYHNRFPSLSSPSDTFSSRMNQYPPLPFHLPRFPSLSWLWGPGVYNLPEPFAGTLGFVLQLGSGTWLVVWTRRTVGPPRTSARPALFLFRYWKFWLGR